MHWLNVGGKRVLVLAPHPDDEVQAAGTIIRLVKGNSEVHYVAFSHCDVSLPLGVTRERLEEECRECVQALGVADEAIAVLNFDVRYFPRDRQEILEEMVRLRNRIRPDLVILPAPGDTHQDHAVIAAEGFRAFKNISLIGYEHLQNTAASGPNLFIRLSDAEMTQKILAASAYASQRGRPYATERFLRSQAAVRGMQCGAEWAEAFEVTRLCSG